MKHSAHKLLIACDLLCSLVGNMQCDLFSYLSSVVFGDIYENVRRGTTADPRISKLR